MDFLYGFFILGVIWLFNGFGYMAFWGSRGYMAFRVVGLFNLF